MGALLFVFNVVQSKLQVSWKVRPHLPIFKTVAVPPLWSIVTRGLHTYAGF